MTGYPWSVVRAAFKGHKRGLQMVETLEKLGFPPPQGYGRGDPGECRVEWFDATGHRDHRDTSMDSWGFKERGQP
jgi:hypothetical protein